MEIYNKYKDKGLVIVSVSFERPTAIDAWKKMIIRDNIVEWINVTNGKFFNCPIYDQYMLTGAGNQILINKDGRIVLRSPDSNEELESKIKELL